MNSPKKNGNTNKIRSISKKNGSTERKRKNALVLQHRQETWKKTHGKGRKNVKAEGKDVPNKKKRKTPGEGFHSRELFFTGKASSRKERSSKRKGEGRQRP